MIISKEKWDALPPEEQERLLKLSVETANPIIHQGSNFSIEEMMAEQQMTAEQVLIKWSARETYGIGIPNISEELADVLLEERNENYQTDTYR